MELGSWKARRANTEPPRVWCTLPFEGRIDHAQEMEQGDKEEAVRLILELCYAGTHKGIEVSSPLYDEDHAAEVLACVGEFL